MLSLQWKEFDISSEKVLKHDAVDSAVFERCNGNLDDFRPRPGGRKSPETGLYGPFDAKVLGPLGTPR